MSEHFSKGWKRIEPKETLCLQSMPHSQSLPCQRSLHAGAVWKDFFIVFGGYDGVSRVNDLYAFSFKTEQWILLSNINAPSPRDRHVACVYGNSLFIFGGFDGDARVDGKYGILRCSTYCFKN